MAKNLKFQNYIKSSSNSSVYRRRQRHQNPEIFYSLSSSEIYRETKTPQNTENFKKLADGRKTFLAERYNQRPSERYTYPIATSMRIGWFHE